jgi:hypothetical protein
MNGRASVLAMQRLIAASAVATIIGVAIVVHQYVASPLGSWVAKAAQVAPTLIALAVAALALLIAWRVNASSTADRADLVSRLNEVEKRVWEGINKTLRDVRRPIEDRLSSSETRLSDVESRLAKIAPTALDFAKTTLAGDPDSYPCLTEGGAIQRFTRSEISELSVKNPEAYSKLAKLNPKLERWRADLL